MHSVSVEKITETKSSNHCKILQSLKTALGKGGGGEIIYVALLWFVTTL